MLRLRLPILSCLLVLAAHVSCGKLRDSGRPGTVQLPLQATSPAGLTYQLRNATFQLTGPTPATLTTGAGADPSTALVTQLRIGAYSAQLLPGWTLVRLGSGGSSQTIQAQLISANPTTFTIASQQETTVGFAFEADGDVVDTSTGTGRIVITVRERDAGADAATDTAPICRQIQQTCGSSSQCCSNFCVLSRCTDGVCSPIDGQCGRSGGTCCAGSYCVLGTRDGDVCFACKPLQADCSSNEQCCTNSCVAGKCTDGSCSQANGPCGRSGGTCCSGSFCLLNGSASGDTCIACRQLQQLCSSNEQCCSNSCVLGRCTDGSCSQVDGPCGRSGGTCCAGSYCTTMSAAGGGGDACVACKALQADCSSNEQCCTNSCVGGKCTDGSCSQVNGFCGRSGGTCCAGSYCTTMSAAGGGGDACVACKALQADCSSNEQCCTNSCVGGKCTDGSCSQVNGFCGRSGGTCCAGSYCTTMSATGGGGDTCVACKALQQTCTSSEQCCSNSCVAGRCTDGSCSQVNGPCGRSGGTCCAGSFCVLNGSASGDTCIACRQVQQSCSGNEQCCSGSCVASRCVAVVVTAPTFVGAGAGVDGTTSLVVPFPAGLQANDLLVLQVGSRTPATTPSTPPAGFSLLDPGEGANPNAYQRLYYRLASGAEAGSLTVTLAAASNVAAGRLYAFRGVALSAFTEGAATSNDNDGTLPGPTVTTTAGGRLAVAFISLDNNPPMAPFVGETGGDWTEAVPEFGSGMGSNFSLQLQITPLPAAATISSGEANFGGLTDASFCRAFALVGL